MKISDQGGHFKSTPKKVDALDNFWCDIYVTTSITICVCGNITHIFV